MPEHVFTIAALGHSVDVQTNNLTLFSVIERIVPPQMPCRMPSLSVATLWRRQPGEEGTVFTQRTRLIDPDGEEIAHLEQSLRASTAQYRVLATLANVPFRKTGTHRVDVYIRPEDAQDWGAAAASYPIDVAAMQGTDEDSLLPSEENGTTS